MPSWNKEDYLVEPGETIESTWGTHVINELYDVIEDLEALTGNVSSHVADESNPHSVTKAQVGLSNVDNVQQATKTEFDNHVEHGRNDDVHGIAAITISETAENAWFWCVRYGDGTQICYLKEGVETRGQFIGPEEESSGGYRSHDLYTLQFPLSFATDEHGTDDAKANASGSFNGGLTLWVHRLRSDEIQFYIFGHEDVDGGAFRLMGLTVVGRYDA